MEKDIIKKYKRFNFQKLSMILLIVGLILTTWNKLYQTSQSMRTKKINENYVLLPSSLIQYITEIVV